MFVADSMHAEKAAPPAARAAFWRGVAATAPLLLGVFPFAMIAGAAAVKAGFSASSAAGLSLILFAGASQLAAVELISANAPVWIVILTVWVVNLRFVFYSATLAPHFKVYTSGWKRLCAYLLTDQAFMLSNNYYGERPDKASKLRFYLGAALALWFTWQTGSILGIWLGPRVPASWSLDFAVPLSFIALLFPAIKDRATAGAGVAAGLSMPLTSLLPLNLGLLVSVMIGVLVGVSLDRRRR